MGTLKVKYEDHEVMYRSLGEMNQIRDQMRKSLGLGKSNTKRVNPSFSKGL